MSPDLSHADKDSIKAAIKRHAPDVMTKLFGGPASGIARLYVAYPDPKKWTYTGLQGVVVLCEDTTGHTLWLKMIDISVGD